jgi:2-dehydropantoate 2-reductase
MGAQEGVATPLCQRVSDLVKEAQARGPGLPDMDPSDLR